MKTQRNDKKTPTSGYYVGSKAGRPETMQKNRTIVGEKLSFAAAEAYKLLRTNLIFSMSGEDACKIVGITSALRREGKSSTAINLAYTIAEANKNVLLIEADMRLPVIAATLGIKEDPGLSNVLAGVNKLNESIQESPLLESLFILPAGELPPNPSELLSSARMEQLLKTLSKSFDYIIIDLPPVNAVSDSLTVSKLLNGMLMVVRKNYCDQHSLAQAMRQLEFLQVKVLGFVMNDADPGDSRYKKYGHKYRYQQEYGYGQAAVDTPDRSKTQASEKAGV